jgi:putative transposase
MRPARARRLVQHLCASYRISIRRACGVVCLDRSTYHYRHRRPEQVSLRKRIRELAEARVRYGYWRIHILLRREGWAVNHKRTQRLYREEGLQLRRKTPKRKVSAKPREDRVVATAANQCWSMDFLSDQLFDGRKIRVLSIVDNFTRLCPAIEARFNYRGADVVATLERIASTYGRPKRIRVDNGPEFVSKDLDLWAWLHGVELDFSRPGKPTDNAFAESFNGKFRTECLNAYWFLSLADAQAKCEARQRDYNHASEHPSVYVIEQNRFYWSGCDPVGCLGFSRARSLIDFAAGVVSTARAKIHGPSGRGWIASISPAAARLSVFGAIFRSCDALLRLSHGSIPSSAGLCTGMR